MDSELGKIQSQLCVDATNVALQRKQQRETKNKNSILIKMRFGNKNIGANISHWETKILNITMHLRPLDVTEIKLNSSTILRANLSPTRMGYLVSSPQDLQERFTSDSRC